MIQKLHLPNVLFLDIETVPQHASYDDLTETEQELWALKTRYKRKEEEDPAETYERAGIWAEFGKIVCLSVGYFVPKQEREFRVTSFVGDELDILENFKTLLTSHFNGPRHIMCAHNGKEFDFPYIARRMITNNMVLPFKLNMHGKKPWEVPHLDTMELWKFGDHKHYTSLKLLCHVLNVDCPKNDIDGSDVARVYYEDKDIDRIADYCESDVVTVAQILLRMRNEDMLEDDEIVYK